MRKTTAIDIFVLLLGAMIVLGSPRAGCEEPYPATLKILAPASNSALPLLVLAATDPIEKVDIQTEIMLGHPQALAALFRGEADLLFTGTSQGWESYLDGGPLVMVNTGVWGVSYLIGSPDAPRIESLAGLAGKRIALPFPGSPLDFQTRYLLEKEGIDPDRDLSISYSPPPQTAALLKKGQIDAAPLPEPLASQLVIGQGLPRLLDYKQLWAAVSGGDPRSPQVSLFVTAGFAGGHRELLAELILAWRQASQQVIEDPAGTAAGYAEVLGFPQEVVRSSIGNTLFYVPTVEENRRRVVEYYGQVKGYLPGKRGDLQADFFLAP